MNTASLEHVNVTVTDPARTAELLCKLFDWQVRWHGPSQMGGHTYHVGTDASYVAVYTYDGKPTSAGGAARMQGGLNHIGVVVDDLDAAEQRVIDAGLKPHTHGDYEPGRRFYFNDSDDIEYEIVSYA